MNAKKCDRCGALYEVDTVNVFFTAVETVKSVIEELTKGKTPNIYYKMISDIELCDECEKSLKEWCKNGRIENNGADC